MDLELNTDQQAIVEAIEALLATHVDPAEAARTSYAGGIDTALDAALHESGFLALGPEVGWLEATLLGEAVAKAGGLTSIGASALMAPAVCGHVPSGPIAAARGSQAEPVRFGAQARTVLVEDGDEARLVEIPPGSGPPLATHDTWPIGRLPAPLPEGERLGTGSGERLRRFWRLAIAAECVGGMQACLDLTVDYVTQRHQFGRAIGSFQAVQHRLAECAVLISGARWMLYEAASQEAPAQQAALVAAHATAAARRVFIETHQLTGAMGFTHEHRLHVFSMRLPVLWIELGGARAHRIEAARLRFC